MSLSNRLPISKKMSKSGRLYNHGYASVLNGTRMGKGNKIHHHAVLGSEPQDFHYTGEDSSLIIGDNNHIP